MNIYIFILGGGINALRNKRSYLFIKQSDFGVYFNQCLLKSCWRH